MKKQAITLVLLAALAISPGCKKVFDYIDQHPDEDHTDCQITEMKFNDKSRMVFSYNKDGNPDSITSYPGNYLRNLAFRYDKKKRLVESWDYFENGIANRWSRYQYNNKGQIISDSTWDQGVFVNGHWELTGFETLILKKYVYDEKGRITDIFMYSPGESTPFDQQEFDYDERGNLHNYGSQSPAAAYDSKMSFYRTHKVFMFYFGNYSLNNPAGATAYNSNYLPTAFSGGNYFFGGDLAGGTISYKCK